MHLQQKNNVKYFCSRMHPFLWWVLHGSIEPIVLKIPEGANTNLHMCISQSAYVYIPISHKISSDFWTSEKY
jgi:hypothetical protein